MTKGLLLPQVGGWMSLMSNPETDNFLRLVLDTLHHIEYNDTPETVTQKEHMQNDFSVNPTQAKIHGLSIQVGELFADLHNVDSNQANHALEAYKSLRRALPLREDGIRHVGSKAAHKATQGL